jgi:hypothetical protein
MNTPLSEEIKKVIRTKQRVYRNIREALDGGSEIFPSLEKLKAANQRMSDATDY